ncbi:MAG TPA: ribonuclease E/G, partial [Labilithrix sp.]
MYLGKVTRVLPGLQAAFIDIGQERAAFLHVEDLIRPDDFDEYLAGGRKLARTQDETAPGGEGAEAEEGEEAVAAAAPAEGENAPVAAPPPTPSKPDDLEQTVSYPNWPNPPSKSEPIITDATPPESNEDVDGEDDPEEERADEEDDDERSSSLPPDEHSFHSAPTLDELPADDDGGPDSDEPPSRASGEDVAQSGGPESVPDAADVADEREGTAVASEDDDLDDDLPEDLPGFTITEPGEPVPRAPAPARTAGPDRGGRGGRGRRRGRGGRGRDERGGGGAAPGDRGARGGDRGRHGGRDGGRGGRDGRGGRSGQNAPGRISKSTPIREVVKEGQEIIVQVTKDPIGTKGARCSSHISLPGRYVVYLPTVEHVGVSKRIGSEKERARLREAIDAMKPPSGGLIVRTVAEGLTKKQLKQDIGYLVRLWGEIAQKREGTRAPNILSSELDLVLKVARDLFTDEV